ncbi:Signal transduction histidine kinase [Pedococcus cremeus]|uniref:histidine kinase n=1 Tax=Pedococcus cremeus TaxID=587636 RepID=A0A1H9XS78_9MICO|nr:Signal transduction histidine kinase [Pedococcus cremeus]
MCLLGVVSGFLFLSPQLHEATRVLTSAQVLIDVTGGVLACAALWWRRRWPFGVALACLAFGTFSIFATAAALIALFSLAVHRPARPAIAATVLWVPSVLLFALYSGTTSALSVLAVTTPLAIAATASGMFLRARRMLLASLRERALRAEADQRLHEEQARMAERTRIAREMHDVLAHRISLLALHAGGLEVRPDLSPDDVKATATLMRSTARQALEELRGVIGLLREEDRAPIPAVRQPTLGDVDRLVAETRQTGAAIDYDMQVTAVDKVPSALGRDAYRIVQEALTNVGKHASGARTRVRVTGAPGQGLHVSVRNADSSTVASRSDLPGAGAGLLGLQERVQLAGGTLVHGPDASGDFVVEADLRW